MAVYSVHGKLGTGKTKFAVWRAQHALRNGLRVASNVDLFQSITPERPLRYIRLPDKPTADDLEAVGHGNPDSYDEDLNGVMILDELGSWLNARSFQDKSRAGVIDFMIHARKRGWHIFLIVQDEGMIDKQVREALVEYSVRCLRMDKVRVPVVGKLIGAFGEVFGFKRWGYLPRFHLATARVGSGPLAIVAERWSYVGDDLHTAYDTRQIFRSDYPHGAHSVLPPWDYAKPRGFWQRRRDLLSASRPPRPELKPKLPAVARIMEYVSEPDRMRAAKALHASRRLRASVEALHAIELAASTSRQAARLED